MLIGSISVGVASDLRLVLLPSSAIWHNTRLAFDTCLFDRVLYITVFSRNIRTDRPMQTLYITKTRLYNFDPLKPHFYIVKLGFIGVYIIFLISAQKYRLWVLVRTASLGRF